MFSWGHILSLPHISRPECKSPKTSKGLRSLLAAWSEKRTELYVRRKRFQDSSTKAEPKVLERTWNSRKKIIFTLGGGRTVGYKNTDTFQRNYYDNGLSPPTR